MAESTHLKNLKHHAKRYGPEYVMEAGLHFELSFKELVELQKYADEVAATRNKYAPKPRLSAETRVKRLLGEEEGEAA